MLALNDEVPGRVLVSGLPQSEDDALRVATNKFFLVAIRNHNTRVAYQTAVRSLFASLANQGCSSIALARPVHLAIWAEDLAVRYSPPTVKQRVAAANMYLNWLVLEQVIQINPATSVKGPRYSQAKGSTPVLLPEEARSLINAIDTSQIIGLRDRALIGVMLYSFARIGAALSLQAGDVFLQNRRLWLRLREKGGKLHDMPCHHELELWIDEYLAHANFGEHKGHPLFPSVDRRSRSLGQYALAPANAYQMVRRRALNAGIKTMICNHTFRATGITAFLSNNGTLEMAARLANHSSTRTTQLYDRRSDAITLSEVERIRF